MAKVVFTPELKVDLKNVVRYTKEKWGNVQAIEYVSGLRKQTSLLAQKPEIGKNRDELAYGLSCFPYVSHIVYYSQITDGIAIIRFLHKRQDPTMHLLSNEV